MKTINKIFGAAIFMSLAFIANGQDWNWGQDVDKAKENNVIYTDALKAKNYLAALEPLNWLYENTPDLNPSIYINGIKIYEGLAKQESDAAKKEEYIQTGLNLHDKRAEIYPDDKNDIMDRKATFAYQFYGKDQSQYPFLYDLYSQSFNANGADMNSGNLVAFMLVTYKHKITGGGLNDEDVINNYSSISEALNVQKDRVTGDKKARYDKMLDQVDKILTATKVEISCDFVEQKLGPKLDQGNDLNMAKKIFGLMLKGKCLDSPLALRAAGIVQENEPTFGVAKFMAQKSGQDGNDEEAIKFFQEAAELTDDNTEKAEMYVSIARIQSKKGQKSTARNSARRALSFDPSHSAAYKLIGDLYMNSFNDCKQEQSQVKDRAVFIAAYNEYRKAGNNSAMSAAKAQFPSISDIFTEGMEEGQSITVGCWINVTVALERRPEN